MTVGFTGFCPIRKGETVEPARINPSMRGLRFLVDNMQFAEGTQVTDGRKTLVQIAQNGSGGVLTTGTPFKWKSTGPGYIADTETGATAADGFTDPHLGSGGVPDTYYFLSVCSGPTKAQKAAGTITVGDQLSTIAAGQVDHITAATPTVLQLSTLVGKAEETSSAAANTLIKIDVRHLT